MMRITEALVIFRTQSVKFPFISLPTIYPSQHHARVSQFFLGVHLRPQQSATVVIWFVPRGCVSRSSYSIYGMRCIWNLLGGSGCIQGLLRWLRSPIAAVRNPSVMDGQRNINTLPGY
uniref:Uncharacterized protein n=1 Tax=Opuntia streptacantha TaxID=393608 RepID=A0A7C9EZF0_OPUST